MKYKYICKNCTAEFEEPFENRKIQSLLTRILTLTCPFCKSTDVDLTELYKLQLTRKAKINKIENESTGYNK